MNRFLIYLSGFCGILLLTFYLLGLTAPSAYKVLLLITGLVLVFAVCLPLIFLERYRQKKKIDQILEKYRDAPHRKIKHSGTTGKKVRGWSIHNSPFRDKKTGAAWSGGNIHGAIPRRGRR